MQSTLFPRLSLLAGALLLAACGTDAPPPAATPAEPAAAPAPTATADADHANAEPDEADAVLLARQDLSFQTVPEAFLTASTPDDNIDSPASWTAPDGRVWLIATAKATDRLVLYRGDTGETLRGIGGPGREAGQFERPNGVFVIGDRVWVVERDNRRVQVLTLPDFTPVGSFGSQQLQKPYGLWVREVDGGHEVLVSDAYMDSADEDRVPPLADLGQRFQRYTVQFGDGGLTATHAGSFGATDEAGAIRISESLWADPAQNRLLLAEEDQAAGTRIKVYRLSDYAYAGQDVGAGLFRAQAEGIALYACEDGRGWWISTDQYKDRSLFHVFERQSLAHVGSFAGNTVANTDGVWLHQAASERFPAGVFYAVHDDQGVAAFDWRDIAQALGLPAGCASP